MIPREPILRVLGHKVRPIVSETVHQPCKVEVLTMFARARRVLALSGFALAPVFVGEASAQSPYYVPDYDDSAVTEWYAMDAGPGVGLVYVSWDMSCYCVRYMTSWQWQQAANDRSHDAFIDYIWDGETGYQEADEYGEYSVYDYMYVRPYDVASYPVLYGGYGYHYDYSDYQMQSWYRQQAANDRAHRAFIEYIRN